MGAVRAITFLIITASMLVRTLFGFGSALISIPLLSILFGAKFAVPFIMLFECLIDFLMILKWGWGIKTEVNRASILLICGLIGIPLGTEVLIYSSERFLKVAMGITLILFAIILLYFIMEFQY